MANEIKTFSKEQLAAVIKELGQPSYRASQLFEWLHTKNASSYDEMTNLPKQLREKLQELYPLTETVITDQRTSSDGARKYLLELEDSSKVEIVGIPDENSNRLTVCFSTQAGCPMECAFCATGKTGFTRNLTSQEMIDQIITVQKDFDRRVSNLVAMGQGEPFLNYDELIKSLRRANKEEGLKIGARHITVSTCGIIDGINRFAEEPEQFTLAISLHSAIQSTRDQIMPKLSSQPLDKLRDALEDYLDKKRRRITFEYLMLKDINDSAEDLEALARYCKGLLCHVNLIPYNQIQNSPFEASSSKQISIWEDTLNSTGISTTVRESKGGDISGACGQLRNTVN